MEKNRSVYLSKMDWGREKCFFFNKTFYPNLFVLYPDYGFYLKAKNAITVLFGGKLILREITALHITVQRSARGFKGHVERWYGKLPTNISQFYPDVNFFS